MLLQCICQKLRCLSNARYKPYVPISSCIHKTTMSVHVPYMTPAINNVTRKTYIHTFPIIGIYACDTAHICPTVLLLWPKYWCHITVHPSPKGTPHTISKYVPETNMPSNTIYISHILITSCAYMRPLSRYINHMNSLQSTIWPGALLYIHFTLLAYAP